MKILKENVLEIILSINQDWVEALKTAEKENKGLDLSEMIGKLTGHMKGLDKVFMQAEERMNKTNSIKKLWGKK